jgi:hypothetical protein
MRNAFLLWVTDLGRYPQRTTERPVIMSTARPEHRKSASFKQESFEQEWQKLAESAQAAAIKQKPAVPKLELRDVNGSGSAVKAQEKSAWQTRPSDQSPSATTTRTQTQTTTTQTTATTQTGPMAHSAPVITPRKQVQFGPETSSESGPSQEKRSARSEKTVDSPRRQKMLSSETARSKRSGSPSVSTTSTPSSSPAVTPREKDQFESPRGLKANQLRKKISTTFSKVALDLSKLNDRMVSGRNSPPSSPSSAGRVSPTKTTPRKKESAFIKNLSYEVRNSAAKCFIKLQKEGNFQHPFSARERLVINAGMIGVLSGYGIKYDLKNLEALAADAENRAKNLIIDKEIDLTSSEFAPFYEKAADAAFMKPWVKDSSDIHDVNGNLMGDRTKAKETFIRDFRNSTYKIKESNGSEKNISSIEEFLNFFDSHENKSVGMIVSNIASQNLGIFLKNSLFRRSDKNGNCQSVLRLVDDTPITPLANFKAVYVLSRDSKDNVILDYESHCDSKTGKGQLMADTAVENSQRIVISDDANITIKIRVIIEPSGEWSIENPHVYAEFWNIPKGD